MQSNRNVACTSFKAVKNICQGNSGSVNRQGIKGVSIHGKDPLSVHIIQCECVDFASLTVKFRLNAHICDVIKTTGIIQVRQTGCISVTIAAVQNNQPITKVGITVLDFLTVFDGNGNPVIGTVFSAVGVIVDTELHRKHMTVFGVIVVLQVIRFTGYDVGEYADACCVRLYSVKSFVVIIVTGSRLVRVGVLFIVVLGAALRNPVTLCQCTYGHRRQDGNYRHEHDQRQEKCCQFCFHLEISFWNILANPSHPHYSIPRFVL